MVAEEVWHQINEVYEPAHQALPAKKAHLQCGYMQPLLGVLANETH
jgi:hypothetical protein